MTQFVYALRRDYPKCRFRISITNPKIILIVVFIERKQIIDQPLTLVELMFSRRESCNMIGTQLVLECKCTSIGSSPVVYTPLLVNMAPHGAAAVVYFR